MRKFLIISITVLLFIEQIKAQEGLRFNNLDSLLQYAEMNSVSVKTSVQQALIAKWQKISAQANLVNFRMQTNFNLTNNIVLPVTYLPGEIFGGAPGSTKEVSLGKQYIGNLNIAPQIDIINPSSWMKLQSADINSELTFVNNLIAKKNLFESISAVYFNIVSLQEQLKLTEKSLVIADTLFLIMQNKYSAGIVRQQDLNDAKINRLTLVDKLEQVKISIEQQYLSLRILCDIPQKTTVIINKTFKYNQQIAIGLEAKNQLAYEAARLKSDLAKSDLKNSKFIYLPTVSLMFYDTWQQNSNETFFDKNTQWLNSQYVGLRITIPFPDMNKFTQTKISKINKTISLQNSEHTKIQNDNNNSQLVLDYQKAFSLFMTAKQIFDLKEQNYQLALNQFNMDILSSDKLLIAFNDKITSRLNYSSALANLLFSKSKIDINNTVK